MHSNFKPLRDTEVPTGSSPPLGVKRALVLGGGGVTGVAWATGVVAGLARQGADLSLADRLIGTSAGAVVGAQLACGAAPEVLLAAQLNPAADSNAQSRPFSQDARTNRLLPVVSGGDIENTIAIDQDATVYVSSLKRGERLTHAAKASRHAYLFVTKGQVVVNGQIVEEGDQLRAKDETQLTIDANEDAELILLDLP